MCGGNQKFIRESAKLDIGVNCYNNEDGNAGSAGGEGVIDNISCYCSYDWSIYPKIVISVEFLKNRCASILNWKLFLQNRIMWKQNLNGIHKPSSVLQEVLKDSNKLDLQIVHTAQLAESVRIKVGIVAIIMNPPGLAAETTQALIFLA
uniref:Uncharacterized protein n=1 Tax=Glossina austeni TaxID=7395 RepID=A0A1A9VI76_GLOAU